MLNSRTNIPMNQFEDHKMEEVFMEIDGKSAVENDEGDPRATANNEFTSNEVDTETVESNSILDEKLLVYNSYNKGPVANGTLSYTKPCAYIIPYNHITAESTDDDFYPPLLRELEICYPTISTIDDIVFETVEIFDPPPLPELAHATCSIHTSEDDERSPLMMAKVTEVEVHFAISVSQSDFTNNWAADGLRIKRSRPNNGSLTTLSEST